jgi:hypothetical protein
VCLDELRWVRVMTVPYFKRDIRLTLTLCVCDAV